MTSHPREDTVHTLGAYGELAPSMPVQGGIKEVVDGGYCVGCGGCAAVVDSGLAMQLDEFGLYRPIVLDSHLASQSRDTTGAVCPFVGRGPHENELAQRFDLPGANYDERLGWFQSLSAGYAKDGSWREQGSSGGLTSWLLASLLNSGIVDAVIEVRQDSDRAGGSLFEFAPARTHLDIEASVKTRYYPVEISKVSDFVRSHPGRYVFVGVPCYVKTVKRLAMVDALIRERVVFHVSIICGHLKSTRFGESLAWQLGVNVEDVESIDFRYKIPGRPANAYGFSVVSKSGETRAAPMSELAGHDWGLGMFRLKACDYCDDVVGETADISFGDAWLPKYASDSAGTNIMIVRNPALSEVLERGRRSGHVWLDELTLDEVVRSQEASFRHRREGLAYRLYLDDRARRWRPWKRTRASSRTTDPVQKRIFRFRAEVSRKSHLVYLTARKSCSLSTYVRFVRSSESKAARLRRCQLYYVRIQRALRRVIRWRLSFHLF